MTKNNVAKNPLLKRCPFRRGSGLKLEQPTKQSAEPSKLVSRLRNVFCNFNNEEVIYVFALCFLA